MSYRRRKPSIESRGKYKTMTRNRLLSLDAMRGVAAITVLFHHVERVFGISFGFPYGYLAVDFFFLMSGFVIANAYEPKMDARLGLWAFFLLRLKRLYPMIALGGLLGIAAVMFHRIDPLALPGPHDFQLGALSVLLVFPLVWSSDVLFPVNIPEWSLFFEVASNLVHRLLHPVLKTPVVVLVMALSVVAMGVIGVKVHGLANGYSPETFWGGFPRAFFSYFLGVLIFRFTSKGALRAPSLPLPLMMLAFLGLVVLEAALGRRVPPSIYWIGCLVVAFPALFLLVINASMPKGFSGFASGLGDLSYPLYAVHVPLLTFAAPFVLGFTGVQRYAAAGLVALGVILIALLLDRIYDRPVRKLLSGPRKPAAPEAEAQIAAP